jgi:thioredoxin 1
MASAKVEYISDADFKNKVLESDVPVLLDFTAAWCGPCKAIAPLLDQVSGEKGDALKVYKIDIDQNTETPNQFGVQSIPTLIFFKGGKVFERKVGSMNKAALDTLVAKVLA